VSLTPEQVIVVVPAIAAVVALLVGIVIGRALGARAARAATLPAAAPTAEPAAPAASDREGAVALLALLQRDGRLIDFLLEDVDGFSDEQVGAAVRDVHRGCRKALREHLALEPVMKDAEGARVTVAAGFDPAAIRLTGAVAGAPPFAGTLRHPGWRVASADLPKSADGIVAPAEVEL
jgi:hypothetical protein